MATGGTNPPPALTTSAAAWTNVTSYSATITLFERAGTRIENSVFAYSFRKPGSVTMHVDSGVNAGANLEWDGGDTVVVSKGHGFMGLFKKTVGLRDPMVATPLGDTVNQISYGSIIEHAEQTPGTLSQTAGPAVDGEPTTEVTLIPATAAADGGLTREVLCISEKTHLPVEVLGYEGSELIRNIAFSNVVLTAPSP
jgi:outer membrane lipoprotein-sorting protein